MNENSTHEDPAAIERDIRRTQDEMSRTVDRLGDQLSIKNIFNSLLDKADESGVDAHYLVDGARRNPIALGLIAAGAIWLVSDKDSKFPTISRGKPSRENAKESDADGTDIHHRDYIKHMSALEMREGEDPASYQRRRDMHRGNFLMCERRPDEDDHSFSKRLDEFTESFRVQRRAWADSASQAGTATKQKTQQLASQASRRAEELYSSNPIISGILAAAVGAALGSALPISRQEQDKLGRLGDQARDFADEQKDQLTSTLRDKKDELVGMAEQTLRPSRAEQSSAQRETGGEAEKAGVAASAAPGAVSKGSPDKSPFMIRDQK